MIDLTTDYLGLRLKNPLVCSPSPLTESLDNIRRMEDAGAAAVVFHSLFEEQLAIEGHNLHNALVQGTESYAESLNYLPELQDYNLGPDRYLEQIAAAKQAVDIPIIASLNGATSGGWVHFARQIESAGADALELNMYDVVTDFERSAADVEAQYLALAKAIRAEVSLPLAVKLSHFFTALPHFTKALDAIGINGLVLFNRFYQPDLDIHELTVQPSLDLSHSNELRLRLRWVAILYGHLDLDLAVTGGVHGAEDIVKAIMAGAACAMTTSALLRQGVPRLKGMLDDLRLWLEEGQYASVEEMRGCLSRMNADGGDELERANYMRVLSRYAARMDI